MSGMPDRTDCTLAGNIVHMCCTGCKDPALHTGSVEGDSGVPWRGRMLEEVGLEIQKFSCYQCLIKKVPSIVKKE